MTRLQVENYVKLCQLSGIVKRDWFKVCFIVRMPEGIMWVEVYADLTLGAWFQYPAKGLQVKL